MDLRGPLRPSDYQDFSQSIGEIGPYYTITFDLWINSIRPGKAFVFRIGNSTIDSPKSTTFGPPTTFSQWFGPMAKRNADYDDGDDVGDEFTPSCGHEMPSVSTKDDFLFNDYSFRVRSFSLESAIL